MYSLTFSPAPCHAPLSRSPIVGDSAPSATLILCMNASVFGPDSPLSACLTRSMTFSGKLFGAICAVLAQQNDRAHERPDERRGKGAGGGVRGRVSYPNGRFEALEDSWVVRLESVFQLLPK